MEVFRDVSDAIWVGRCPAVEVGFERSARFSPLFDQDTGDIVEPTAKTALGLQTEISFHMSF